MASTHSGRIAGGLCRRYVAARSSRLFRVHPSGYRVWGLRHASHGDASAAPRARTRIRRLTMSSRHNGRWRTSPNAAASVVERPRRLFHRTGRLRSSRERGSSSSLQRRDGRGPRPPLSSVGWWHASRRHARLTP